jgi:hypothetical protein
MCTTRSRPWWPPRPARAAQRNAPLGEVRLARGLDAPSGGVRLARGLDAPSGEVRLARGLNAPSGEVRLARGPPRDVAPAPAHAYGHLMLCHRRTAPRPWHAWESRPGAVPPTPWGRPSPPLCNTVWWGWCQPHDTVPPTSVRLTRRSLEGGPAEPSNAFPVTTQGYAVTSGRR